MCRLPSTRDRSASRRRQFLRATERERHGQRLELKSRAADDGALPVEFPRKGFSNMTAESQARLRWIVVCHLAALVAASSFLAMPVFAAAPDRRPNILFIFSDDHAAHAMSCYGSRINKTPNLDRIAAGGMLFHNCFCTNSVCGPSRAVVLTGKYSHLNGFYRNGDRFDGRQPTFAKMLQKAGYQTALIGKWHLASDPTGFDLWKILIGLGTYYNPVLIENGKHVKHTGYATDLLADETINYLKARDPNRPFLLM